MSILFCFIFRFFFSFCVFFDSSTSDCFDCRNITVSWGRLGRSHESAARVIIDEISRRSRPETATATRSLSLIVLHLHLRSRSVEFSHMSKWRQRCLSAVVWAIVIVMLLVHAFSSSASDAVEWVWVCVRVLFVLLYYVQLFVLAARAPQIENKIQGNQWQSAQHVR